jgi:hypothetical protein
MSTVDATIAAITGKIELFLISIPESVGLLIFGAILIIGAVLTRRHLRETNISDLE